MILLQRRTQTGWVNIDRYLDETLAAEALRRRVDRLAINHIARHYRLEDGPIEQWEASVWRRARAAWRLEDEAAPRLHPRWNVPNIYAAVPDRHLGSCDDNRRDYPATNEGLQAALCYARQLAFRTEAQWRVFFIRGTTKGWRTIEIIPAPITARSRRAA